MLLAGFVTFYARNQLGEEVGAAPSLPAAVVAGSVPTPRAASARPTATPLASPAPMITPIPTTAPTPTPTPAPVLPAEAAVLDHGGWAVVNADDVVIRTQPFREAPSDIIGTYDAGAYVQILDGPVVGSGYYWFFVEGEGPTGWVAAGTGAGAWIVSSDAPTTTAALSDGTVSIPGAEIVYYDIVGSSPAQLREQISRFGPVSEPGSDVIAVARFIPEWADVPVTETTEVGGVFSTTSYYVCKVGWRFEVTVPRWVGPSPAPQPAIAWWTTALARIVEHEATHVRIWQEALPQLESRLSDEMPCSEATEVLYEWLYEVDAAQSAFDAEHGYLDWPSAPSLP